MVYIEIQDKKTQVRDEKNELQAVLFDWYSIDPKSFDWYSIGTQWIESRISAKNQQTSKAHNLTI